MIVKFGDQIIFDTWSDYLKENIHSKKDAWNFMMSFIDYNGHHFNIDNPYPFLGLLLNKLELSLDKDLISEEENAMFDSFDSLYIELLINSGIVRQEMIIFI